MERVQRLAEICDRNKTRRIDNAEWRELDKFRGSKEKTGEKARKQRRNSVREERKNSS